MTRVRRKPVPRLTRLPTAMTALLPAALPLGVLGRRRRLHERAASIRIRADRAAAVGRGVRAAVDAGRTSRDPDPKPRCARDVRLGPIRWRSHVRNLLPTRGSRDLTAAQRSAVAELLRVSPVADELGRRFAKAGHELHLVGGPVRDALLGRLGDDLDFCTDARPDETLRVLQGLGRGDLGDRSRVRHDRRPARRAAAGDHHVPRRGVRRGEPQPGRALRHEPDR